MSSAHVPRGLLYAVVGAVVLALLSACATASDVVEAADEPSPTETETETEPEPEPTPSPTPEPEPDPAPKKGCRTIGKQAALRGGVNNGATVSCSKRHTSVTFHVGTLPKKATRSADPASSTAAEYAGLRTSATSDPQVQRAGEGVCRKRFKSYVGGGPRDRKMSLLDWQAFVPDVDQLALGARWVRCDAFAYKVYQNEFVFQLASLQYGVKELKGALNKTRLRNDLARCSPAPPGAEGFRHVLCSRKHSWRVVDTYNAGGANERYPSNAQHDRRGKGNCEPKVTGWSNRTNTDVRRYGYEAPGKLEWASGRRYGLCWAETNA